jgi:predicted  nucleic acid-binding Zn-ribbon protein
MQVKDQIVALERAKEFHHEKYLNNIQVIDDKIDRIEKQLEKTKSQVKRDLLKRTLDWYEEEINKMDEAVDVVTTKIDSEIQRLQEIIKSAELRREKEKKSFEYNIENIRKCCKNRSTATLFDALESVANALEIIRAETGQKSGQKS